MFKGWKNAEFWVLAFAQCLIAGALITIADLWNCTDCNRSSTIAAWVQAIGSIAAIGTAFAVMLWQHRLDRKAVAAKEMRDVIALLEGTLQLVGGVRGIAEKVQKAESLEGGIQPRDIRMLSIEVGGVVAALGRVDHLRFDSHELIEGILVAESIGGAMLYELKNTLERMDVSGLYIPQRVLPVAADCIRQLTPRMDVIHARSLKRQFELNELMAGL